MDGYYEAVNAQLLEENFSKVSLRIAHKTQSYYVLKYCSPKIAGQDHELNMVINEHGAQGSLLINFPRLTFILDAIHQKKRLFLNNVTNRFY